MNIATQIQTRRQAAQVAALPRYRELIRQGSLTDTEFDELESIMATLGLDACDVEADEQALIRHAELEAAFAQVPVLREKAERAEKALREHRQKREANAAERSRARRALVAQADIDKATLMDAQGVEPDGTNRPVEEVMREVQEFDAETRSQDQITHTRDAHLLHDMVVARRQLGVAEHANVMMQVVEKSHPRIWE